MLLQIVTWVRTRLQLEQGATMVEYGIMVALIAAVSILVITTLGLQVRNAFQAIVDALPGVGA